MLWVYSLEEIMVEKLCALLGRTEPRDLFDIHYLPTQSELDLAAVSFGLEEKMHSKGLIVADLKEVLERKQGTLSRLWEPRLQGQLLDDLSHLDAVIRETNRLLRQKGIV
jgi:predicted nucleotidyltransferase component of viral defense system